MFFFIIKFFFCLFKECSTLLLISLQTKHKEQSDTRWKANKKSVIIFFHAFWNTKLCAFDPHSTISATRMSVAFSFLNCKTQVIVSFVAVTQFLSTKHAVKKAKHPSVECIKSRFWFEGEFLYYWSNLTLKCWQKIHEQERIKKNCGFL